MGCGLEVILKNNQFFRCKAIGVYAFTICVIGLIGLTGMLV